MQVDDAHAGEDVDSRGWYIREILGDGENLAIVEGGDLFCLEFGYICGSGYFDWRGPFNYSYNMREMY